MSLLLAINTSEDCASFAMTMLMLLCLGILVLYREDKNMMQS